MASSFWCTGLFLGFSVFGAFLGGFLLGLDFLIDFLGLLIFGIVNTHAGQLVFDGHDGMTQEHALARRVHDLEELLRLLRAEARALAADADRLRDAVRAAVHLRHDRRQECRALRAELVARRAVMAVAVDAERLADIRLLLRDIILDLYRFLLRQETRENTHVNHPSLWFQKINTR